MKTKILLSAIFSCVLLLSGLGCKKFLELKSDAKLVVPKSLSDLQGILDDATQMNLSRSPSFGETSSDDYFIPDVNLNALSELQRNIYVWKKIDYRYQNDWSEAYLPVYNSNMCLEILESIERTPANAKVWDNIKGSALFYRSFYFFALTMEFGHAFDSQKSSQDLGIVLRMQTNFNIASQRSNVLECLERVLADASDAAKYLPDFQVNTLRPSKAAAYALLSRVYLYMRDYPNAQKFANECLKIQSSLMDFNNDPDILGLDVNVPFKKFNKETIFYCEMFSGFGLHIPNPAKIDSALYVSYDANDLRKRAYFRVSGTYQQFKGNYSSSSFTLFSGLATDEVYLNCSEAKAWNGDLAGAMDDLNVLLKTRWKNSVPFIPVAASTTQEALRVIRMERRKELLMRNIRWQDIKRLNKEGAGIVPTRVYKGQVYKLDINNSYYALPLPIDVIEQSGMPQN